MHLFQVWNKVAAGSKVGGREENRNTNTGVRKQKKKLHFPQPQNNSLYFTCAHDYLLDGLKCSYNDHGDHNTTITYLGLPLCQAPTQGSPFYVISSHHHNHHRGHHLMVSGNSEKLKNVPMVHGQQEKHLNLNPGPPDP